MLAANPISPVLRSRFRWRLFWVWWGGFCNLVSVAGCLGYDVLDFETDTGRQGVLFQLLVV